MVRRVGSKRRRSSRGVTKVIRGKRYVCKTKGGVKTAYKKCLIAAIRGAKAITTPKAAAKAFARAKKHCNAILTGKAPARRRRAGSKSKRPCKFGRLASGKCRKSRAGTRTRRRRSSSVSGRFTGDMSRRAFRAMHSPYLNAR